MAARCAVLGELGSEQRRLLCAATMGKSIEVKKDQ